MNKWFYRFFFEPLRSVMAGNKTVAVLFIILGALLLYLPCLSYDFFAVDDWAYVQKNEFIRSFSWDHLRIFFTRSFVNLWLPVTMLSYSLDHTIWGTNAFGYHFTNLVLHLLNIFFVYHLFLRLKCPHSIAILSSAIFAIHPVQIESVVWISERKNVLSFFFFLLSCLHWLSWLQTRKGSSGVFTLFFFALSVFSKPVFVFGPVLFAIAAASFSDDGIFQTKKDIIKKHLEGKGLAILLGCAALGLTAICMTLYSHASGQSLTLPLSYTGRERFLTALTLPWAYSKNLLFPFSLSISYLPETVSSFFNLKILYGLALTAACLYGILRLEWPFIYFWAAWILITMAPVSTLIPIPTWMNDRYLYGPLPALSVLFVSALHHLFTSKKGFYILAAAAILFLWFPSKNQIRLWKKSGSLYQASVKRCPASIQCRNWLLNLELERIIKDKKQLIQIEELADQALTVKADDAYAIYCKSLCLVEKNKPDEALKLLFKGLRAFPHHPYLNRTCGNIYMQKGEYQKALRFYSFIPITDKQEAAEALVDQMKILLNRKDYQRALKVGALLIARVPERPESFNLLAVAEHSLGLYAQAKKTLTQGLRKHPSDEMLRENLITLAVQMRKNPPD